MKEITLKLKVITPLFMGGANQEPELRTQSIKGIIRWWWRALKAENDLKKLNKEESKIFGGHIVGEDKDEKEAISSDVKIFLEEKNIVVKKDLKQTYNLEWTFENANRTLTGNHCGIGYLFYSVLSKKFIDEKSYFLMKIKSKNENAIKQTLAALWCAIYLGNFGARSRRGAGSLIVEKIENNITDINFIPSNGESLENWIKTNFQKCQDIIGKPKDFCYAYSNLSISRILISKQTFNSWIEALNDIGKAYADFRFNNRKKIFESAAFGLPIIHKSGKVLTNNKDIKRRSSPLIFKIIQFNNQYYWFVIRLAGEFLPNNTVVYFNDKTQKVDYSFIDVFWNELKKYSKESILSIPEKFEDFIKKLKGKGAEKIILFGSKARGDFKEKSDTDIAIDKSIELEVIGNYDIVNINNCDKRIVEKIKSEGILL